jgi:hypothetical protein
MRIYAFPRWVISMGATCLVVVVLTHIAEQFNILPAMGWGLWRSN